MSYYEDIRLVAIKLGRCLRIPKEPWYQPWEFYFTACTRTFQDVYARLSVVKDGTTPMTCYVTILLCSTTKQ